MRYSIILLLLLFPLYLRRELQYQKQWFCTAQDELSNKILYRYLEKVADYDAWILIGCNYCEKSENHKSRNKQN